MREQIMEAVRCKPVFADELAARFGVEVQEVLQALSQLRREGRVRKGRHSEAWHWDEDFVCPDCDVSWPAVRRAISQVRCLGCYAIARRHPHQEKAVPTYVVTRFSPADVDRHFAGRLAAEWASKPLGACA